MSEVKRRELLFTATAAVGGVCAVGAVWPIFRSMGSVDGGKPIFQTHSFGKLEPGQQMVIKFEDRPVFIRHLTSAEFAMAKEANIDDLRDDNARNRNFRIIQNDPRFLSEATRKKPTFASFENRLLDPARPIVVVYGTCTRLGCIPVSHKGDFGGWFCPCGGAHYDVLGRIRKGPAPENLAIPLARLEGDTITFEHSPKWHI